MSSGKKAEMWEPPSVTIAATTQRVTVQHTRAINGRSETCLKFMGVCDGTWANDEKSFKAFTRSADQHRKTNPSTP
jgi:hypothetical protein